LNSAGSSGELNVPVFQEWDVKDEVKGKKNVELFL
jgi:hypothetical protein